MVQEVAFRAYHPVNLPRSRSVERVPYRVGTLTRVSSVPCVHTLRVSKDTYRGSGLHKYRRDYDLTDDWEKDRVNFYQPFHFSTYRYQARRQLLTDPIPNSLGFQYPGFFGRYKFYYDWLNPTMWRKHRDPNYDRPLWNHWRPWQYNSKSIKDGIDLYRKGIIPFDVLDKKWIEPTALARKGKDWFDVYTPAPRYGAHRYFFTGQVY
ncbi:unnamed protein product, partial [Mesorhabditis belari]|uniref:Uncharacterized protein n=1 Tax=Mesorhabditis belari TaxID=2138241 RepID=A0AAF3FIR6_9BILA